MFCKYCGNQVPDGQVCNCADAVAARNAAAAPVATAAPEAAPVAAPAAPAGGVDLGKIIGDAFKGTPAALKTLLGNTEGPGINTPVTVVLAVGSLILNMLAWVLMAAGVIGALKDAMGLVWNYVKAMFEGIYGFAFLGGLWTCIVPIALSMIIIIVGQLLRKEKVDLLSAFTTGTCVNIAPAAILLVGGLFCTFLPLIGVILILIAIVYSLAANYKLAEKLVGNTNTALGGLIASAVVAVVAALMAMIVWGVLSGYVEDLFSSVGEGLGGMDITDLLEGLLGNMM